MDDSFENELFNFVNESEFIDYLTERYGNEIFLNEVITTYTYLWIITERLLSDELLFAKGWNAEMSGIDYVFKHKDVYGFEIAAYDYNGTSVYYVHGTNICLKYEEDLNSFVELSNKLDRNCDWLWLGIFWKPNLSERKMENAQSIVFLIIIYLL